METHQLKISNVAQLPQAAGAILQLCKNSKVWAFYGEMGSGKTTLIKEICRQLGSKDSFSSPTYSIVNEYLVTETKEKMYHIDLYRIRNLEEAISAGIEDYIGGNSYCFIEWPEIIEPLLPADTIKISITPEANIRNVSIFIG